MPQYTIVLCLVITIMFCCFVSVTLDKYSGLFYVFSVFFCRQTKISALHTMHIYTVVILCQVYTCYAVLTVLCWRDYFQEPSFFLSFLLFSSSPPSFLSFLSFFYKHAYKDRSVHNDYVCYWYIYVWLLLCCCMYQCVQPLPDGTLHTLVYICVR